MNRFISVIVLTLFIWSGLVHEAHQQTSLPITLLTTEDDSTDISITMEVTRTTKSSTVDEVTTDLTDEVSPQRSTTSQSTTDVPPSSTFMTSSTPPTTTSIPECVDMSMCSSCYAVVNCGWCVDKDRCTVEGDCSSSDWLKEGSVGIETLDNKCGIADLLGIYTVEIEPVVGILELEGETDLLVIVSTDKTVLLNLDSITVAGITCDQATLAGNSPTTREIMYSGGILKHKKCKLS
ncbi:uncharacterized protein LOC144447177 [Glandiceps talaboti]